MKISDDLEWNFEKCLNRFNSMGSLYKISNFVKSRDFPFKVGFPNTLLRILNIVTGYSNNTILFRI